MSFLIFAAILAGIFLFVMIKGTLDEQKKRREYRVYLEQKFGAYPISRINVDDIKRISKRYRYFCDSLEVEKRNVIDEITWNDLEMDRLFTTINVTQSAAGAEYLYMMLRMPQLQSDRLETLEQHITYFDANKEDRVRIQEICHELGNMGKYSIYDYIQYLSGAKADNKIKHVLLCVCFFVSFPLLFINTSAGVFWLIVITCVNVVSYLNTKHQILPYLTGISYVRRLLATADALAKSEKSEMPQAIKALYQELKENAQQLGKFRSYARFVSGMNATSGSPVQLITDYLRMFTHIDLIQYNLMVEELQKHKNQIVRNLDIVGYVDAVISIASYRRSCNVWSVPELCKEQKQLKIEQGVHPLLKQPVPNDYTGKRGMLVTGSNASGKSTFLKMVALNAVLAQTIHTVTARHYEGQLYRIYSSMALRDSLSGGDSYYMVEIKALKRIMDASLTEGAPLLCFVDEVLRGTNTVERIAASSQILKQLADRKVYCLAATHDVELTYLLENEYDNYHFREDIDGKDIVFSYKLLPGRATTRNAIKLLNQLGFDACVVDQAEALANRFIETNQWG